MPQADLGKPNARAPAVRSGPRGGNQFRQFRGFEADRRPDLAEPVEPELPALHQPGQVQAGITAVQPGVLDRDPADGQTAKF